MPKLDFSVILSVVIGVILVKILDKLFLDKVLSNLKLSFEGETE